MPCILVNKVAFPGQVLQIETAHSSFQTQRPKQVFVLPILNDEENGGTKVSPATLEWGVVARVMSFVMKRNTTKVLVRCVVRGKLIAKLGEAPNLIARVQAVTPDDEQPPVPEADLTAFRKILLGFFEVKNYLWLFF
jgi:hypothetical protein